MRTKSLLVLCLALLIGCAPYKQLKPKPELSPAEAGYIELTKDKEVFKLKPKGKYYIQFPGPQEDKYYLVLNIGTKSGFNSFLVDFYEGKKLGAKIPDESPQPASQSAFPVNMSPTGYFWMIDNVKQEMDLKVQYRYAPQWRFKFETKSDEFKKILKDNRVDRANYTNLGASFHFDGFDIAGETTRVTKTSGELDKVHKELLAIESIFPKSILNSSDKAYLDYKELRAALEEEMQFQAKYLSVLDFFAREQKVRGDVPGFMANVEDFIRYFGAKDRLPANVVQESQRVLGDALTDILGRYDKRLAGKTDPKPLDTASYCMGPLNRVSTLYRTAGLTMPSESETLVGFVNDFDKTSRAFFAVRDSAARLQKAVQECAPMPGNDVFTALASRAAACQSSLPKPLGEQHGKYLTYKCATILNDEISKLTGDLATRVTDLRTAERLVPQVNAILTQRDFHAAISTLRQNQAPAFLLEKYRRIDTLSVQNQERNVREGLTNYRWLEAETALKDLSTDDLFLYPPQVLPLRDRRVSDLEDSLYIGIDRVSRARIDKFLLDNVDTLENIDSLYTDSVFLPAYDVTFSTGSKKELYQRKADLVAHLAKVKENEFPAKAITLMFEQFTKNPDDNGVLKGRAIVAHGAHYKGDDDKIKKRVAEVDPDSPKWIVEAKQYRRVYVLPATDKRKGTNRYLFRVNIRVPTEAQFPVYDVNIKLPKELAQNAAQEQWYEQISINKTPLKNEGRFSITAPTASNEYECQITPVSVNKDKSNYLDVSFQYPAFKVFVVSVMVQKPIIKKN